MANFERFSRVGASKWLRLTANTGYMRLAPEQSELLAGLLLKSAREHHSWFRVWHTKHLMLVWETEHN